MTDKEETGNFYQTRNILGEDYNPMDMVRFSEIPTFMRAPLVQDLSRVDIGVIGIPYDGA